MHPDGAAWRRRGGRRACATEAHFHGRCMWLWRSGPPTRRDQLSRGLDRSRMKARCNASAPAGDRWFGPPAAKPACIGDASGVQRRWASETARATFQIERRRKGRCKPDTRRLHDAGDTSARNSCPRQGSARREIERSQAPRRPPSRVRLLRNKDALRTGRPLAVLVFSFACDILSAQSLQNGSDVMDRTGKERQWRQGLGR